MSDLTPENIIAFFNTLDPTQAAKFFQTLLQGSTTFSTAFNIVQKQFDTANDSLKTMNTRAKDAFDSFKNMTQVSFDNFIQSITHVNSNLVTMGVQTAQVFAALRANMPLDNFSMLNGQLNRTSDNLSDTIGVVSKGIGVFKEFGGDGLAAKVSEKAQAFARLADSARDMESGLIRTAAASGQLGELFNSLGGDLSGLSLKSEKFSKDTFDAAQANGLVTGQVANYAAELLKIPGALDTVISSTQKGKKDMSLLDATIKASIGTGQEFGEAFRVLDKVYKNFGTSGEDALKVFTRIGGAANDLKIPLDIVKEFTNSAADSFKYFGDNTQASINLLGQFETSLKGSGIGPKAIADLVQDMTGKIQNLGLANKAFLSGQTGGPGGLKGAFQIDLLIKQGKIDEVYKKVEENLKKEMGGRITILEQGANGNVQDANNLAKEVMLLKSGPTPIASSDSEAYAILEKMNKGISLNNEIQSPEKAFKSALYQGEQIEQRQSNELTSIRNVMERNVQLGAISAYNLTRLVAGSEKTDLASALRNSREQGSALAASSGSLIKGTGIEGGRTTGETIKDYIKDFPENIKNTGKGFDLAKDHIMGIGKDIKNKIMQNSAEDENFIKRQSSRAKSQPSLPPEPFKPSIPPDSNERVNSSLLGEQKENNKNNLNQSQTPPETLNINVDVSCAECNKKVAHQTATKVGNKLIQANDSSKSMFLTNGTHGAPIENL